MLSDREHPVTRVLRLWVDRTFANDASRQSETAWDFFRSDEKCDAFSRAIERGPISDALIAYKLYVCWPSGPVSEPELTEIWPLAAVVRWILELQSGFQGDNVRELFDKLLSVTGEHQELTDSVIEYAFDQMLGLVEDNMTIEFQSVSNAMMTFLNRQEIDVVRRAMIRWLKLALSGTENLTSFRKDYFFLVAQKITDEEDVEEVLLCDVINATRPRIMRFDMDALCFLYQLELIVHVDDMCDIITEMMAVLPRVRSMSFSGDEPEEYFDCATNEILQFVGSIVKRYTSVANKRMNQLQKVVKTDDVDLLIAVAIVLKRVGNLTVEIVGSILDSPIFEATLSVFDVGDGELWIARRMIRRLCVLGEPVAFNVCVKRHWERPQMLGELLIQTAREIMSIDVSVFQNVDIGGVLEHFRSLDDAETFVEMFELLDRGEFPRIEKANDANVVVRACLLWFASRAVKVYEFAVLLDKRRIWCMSFLPLALHEKVAKIVIDIISCLWSHDRIQLDNSMNSIADGLPQRSDTVFGLMTALHDTLVIRPEQRGSISPHFLMLAGFADVATSTAHLLQLFALLSLIPGDFNGGTCSVVLTMIRRYEGDEPCQAVRESLMWLLMRDIGKYAIVRPNVVYVLIKSHMRSDELSSVFKFLEGVCLKSFANATHLHEVKIPVFILDHFRSDIPEHARDAAMGLFRAVTTKISSMPVVHRYIESLCPIGKSLLSSDSEFMVRSLKDIFVQRKEHPLAYVPCVPGSFETYHSFSHVSMGFLFKVTVFRDVDSIEYPASLIKVYNSRNDETASVAVVDGRIHVNDVNIGLEIPTGRWISVGVFFAGGTHREIIATVDGGVEKTVKIDWLQGDQGPVKCVVGGALSDNGREGILMSLVMLQPQEVDADNRQDGSLQLRDVDLLSHLNNDGKGRFIIQVIALPDVLVCFFGAAVLIPLFAQLDFERPESPSEYGVAIVELISEALARKTVQKLTFLSKPYFFEIIAFLLGKASSRHLTFALYKRFDCMRNSLSDQAKIESLFRYILLNSTLWKRADDENLAAIFGSWNRRQLANDWDTFCKLKPVMSLVDDVKAFYLPNTELQKGSLRLLREEVVALVCDIAEHEFTMEDLKAIVETCCSSDDPDYVREILAMLKALARMKSAPIKRLGYGTEAIMAELLLQTTKPRFAFIIFDTFLVLNDQGVFMAGHYNQCVEILVRRLKCGPIEVETMVALKELVVSRQELVPTLFELICYGGEELLSYIPEIAPGTRMKGMKMWIMWPLTVAVQFPRVAQSILTTIVESNRGEWETIFCTIDIIARSLDIDVVTHQRLLLVLIARFLLEYNADSPNVEEFLALAQYFMFMKPFGYVTPMVKAVVMSSPFDIEEDDLANCTYNTENHASWIYDSGSPSRDRGPDAKSLFGLAPEDRAFFENIASVIDRKYMVRFGVDVSENKAWSDMLLGSLVSRVIDKYRLTKFNRLGDWCCAATRNRPSDFDWNAARKNYGDPNDLNVKRIVSIPQRIAMFIWKFKLKATRYAKELGQELDRHVRSRRRNMRRQRKEMRISNGYDVGRKHWGRLWRSITVERSPWEKALRQEKIHYKHDPLLTEGLYPAKLKRNRKFDPHVDASIVRDIGSLEVVKEKLVAYRAEIVNRKLETAPHELFDVGDEEENDRENQQDQAENHAARIVFQGDAMFFTVSDSVPCVVSFHRNCVKIAINKNDTVSLKVVQASDVEYILFRKYLQRDRGLSIITKSGREYFVSFLSAPSLPILKKLATLPQWNHSVIQTTPHGAFIAERGIRNDWVQGKISNFDYLMKLNIFGGRSFSEASMYPVFPWVLRDYESETIDLHDEKIFRDLTKPVGALSESRLNMLKERIKDLWDDQNTFLYSSCYIAPLCVFLWLMRVEPFATLHIKLQSGRFDHAARLFTSIYGAFDMAMTQLNDYRELLPEFFISSAFLENRNRFDLGSFNETHVDHVVLPPWAESAFDFVYVNRKALESEYVSRHLQDWIDLIWGYKSSGKCAVDFDNTFDPHMYEDAWDMLGSDIERETLITGALMMNCGHMPPQLFSEPHPAKMEAGLKLSFVVPMTLAIEPRQACVGHILQRSESVFTFLFSESGYVSSVVCDTSADSVRVVDSRCEVTIRGDAKRFSKSGDIFVVDGSTIAKVNPFTGVITSYAEHTGQVNCVSSSSNFVITGSGDTVITISTPAMSHRFTSFRGAIVCCDVSDVFRIAVACTEDGSLFLISTATNVTTRVVEMPSEVPVMVEITRGWGFIVVLTNDPDNHSYLTVFDVNGELLRRRRIDIAVAAWTHWTTQSGFDYFAIAGKDRRMYTFEAFYLDVEEFHTKVSSAPIALRYFCESHVLAVMCNDSISFCPSHVMKIDRFDQSVFGRHKKVNC